MFNKTNFITIGTHTLSFWYTLTSKNKTMLQCKFYFSMVGDERLDMCSPSEGEAILITKGWFIAHRNINPKVMHFMAATTDEKNKRSICFAHMHVKSAHKLKHIDIPPRNADTSVTRTIIQPSCTKPHCRRAWKSMNSSGN